MSHKVEDIKKARNCGILLRPYHHFVIEQFGGERSKVIQNALEKLAAEKGLSEKQFLAMPGNEKYIKGFVSAPGQHSPGYVRPDRRK